MLHCAQHAKQVKFRLLDKKIATSGWGLYPLVAASVQRARYLSDLGRAAATPILPQGNCRSYGDACLYERVVSTLPLKHLLDFDPQRGLLRAQAGITFAEIIRFALPQGFFRPLRRGPSSPRSAAALPRMCMAKTTTPRVPSPPLSNRWTWCWPMAR